MSSQGPEYDCDQGRARHAGALERLSRANREIIAATSATNHVSLAGRAAQEEGILREVAAEARAADHWECLGEAQCRVAGRAAVQAVL